MAATCDIKAKTISDLPSEILSHIFTFLPHNLKVVRLVCSKWHEACNTEKVSGHEEIVLCTNRGNRPNEEYVDEFLRNRTHLRKIYNLDIWNTTLTTHHASFFEKFGGQLRSLSLTTCTANEYGPFLQYCENLNTLLLSECIADEYTPFLHYCKNLNTLELGYQYSCRDSTPIVRSFRYSDGSFIETNITSLRIKFDGKWSDETMDACFRICPHLRSLSLVWCPPIRYIWAKNGVYSFEDGEEPVFNRSDILSFSCLHHALSIRAVNIVELDFYALNGILPEQFEQIASIPDMRLRKLKIDNHETLTNRNILNIVNRQPDLQSIAIGGCDGISSNGLADWIDRCSKLTHLELNPGDDEEFVVDGKLFNALTSRRHLRELVLTPIPPAIIGDFENCRGTFDHLRKLELKIRNFHCNFVLGRVSINLNHLILWNVSRNIMQFISNRFTNLEILSVSSALVESDLCDGDSSDRKSSWNFGKLKTLEIYVLREDEPSPSSLFRRIEAPNLRVLDLHGFDPIDATLLSEMVIKYPLLESFHRWRYNCSQNMELACLPIISEWKMLRSFKCGHTEYVHLLRRRV